VNNDIILFRAFNDERGSQVDYCDRETADALIDNDACCYAALLELQEGIPVAVQIKGDRNDAVHDREATEVAQEPGVGLVKI
jgi:hypothetical protein